MLRNHSFMHCLYFCPPQPRLQTFVLNHWSELGEGLLVNNLFSLKIIVHVWLVLKKFSKIMATAGTGIKDIGRPHPIVV